MINHLSLIYVVAPDEDGPTKIGLTRNIEVRLQTLQIGNWEKLHVFGGRLAFRRDFSLAYSLEHSSREGAERMEHLAHKKLRECDLNLSGEWFDVTVPEALQVLEKIAKNESIGLVSMEDVAGIDFHAFDKWDMEAVTHIQHSLACVNQFIVSRLDGKFKSA